MHTLIFNINASCELEGALCYCAAPNLCTLLQHGAHWCKSGAHQSLPVSAHKRGDENSNETAESSGNCASPRSRICHEGTLETSKDQSLV
jgi:hypothetical protein